MSPRDLVVLSLLGPSLDQGKGPARWERWRSTVALCQHEDLLIRRLELFHQPRFTELGRLVAEDVRHISPETEVRLRPLDMPDPWDFEQVYGALHDAARTFPFQLEKEDYLVHITTGTHVAQICLFLLTESRHLPARLIQTSPPRKAQIATAGDYSIIDLDLSRYDRLASRFQAERAGVRQRKSKGRRGKPAAAGVKGAASAARPSHPRPHSPAPCPPGQRPPWAEPRGPPARLAALPTDSPTTSPPNDRPPKTTAPPRGASPTNEHPPSCPPRGLPTEPVPRP